MASVDDDEINPFAAPMSDLEPGSIALDSHRDKVEYANFGLRLVAAIVDGILLRMVGVALGIGLALAGLADDKTFIAIIDFLFAVVVSWLYHAIQESSERQASIGKRLMGIVVIDENTGKRISFEKATGRHFGKILSTMLLFIGYLMQPFTKKKQALHDMMAGTLVVKA